MKTLCCGCCGTGFEKWEGYVDQDQDKGYGICASCQDYIEVDNRKAMDDIMGKVRETLNPANLAKFESFDRKMQEAVVYSMMDKGIISWSVGSR